MSTTPRNWLCLITSDKELENVDELTRDIHTHFDGICCVVHKQGGDDRVASLLRARQGAGFVIERSFAWHHGHSQNEWLLHPAIRAMDVCHIRDSSERFNPSFTKHLKAFSADLLLNGIHNLFHQGKLLSFRRWYGMQFHGGLHWGLHGLYGSSIDLGQIAAYADPKSCAYSVRNDKRPPTHRYDHECRYLLDYGLNGNHLALFHREPAALDAAYHRLHAFTSYLAERGVSGVDQFTEWLQTEWAKGEGLPAEVRTWINAERPFRNLFRFEVLHHSDAIIKADEDTWRLD